jgi:hypothetical protein
MAAVSRSISLGMSAEVCAHQSSARSARLSVGREYPRGTARSRPIGHAAGTLFGLLLPKPTSQVGCHGLNMAELASVVRQRPPLSVAGDDDSYSLGYSAPVEPRAALSCVDHQLGRSGPRHLGHAGRTLNRACWCKLTVGDRGSLPGFASCGPCVAHRYKAPEAVSDLSEPAQTRTWQDDGSTSGRLAGKSDCQPGPVFARRHCHDLLCGRGSRARGRRG